MREGKVERSHLQRTQTIMNPLSSPKQEGVQDGEFGDSLHFKWFNSHHVPLEVQVGIARLELPLDLQVKSSNVPEDVYITARIMCNQQPVHTLSLGTHFALADEFRNALVWDYVMSFPLKIQNLSPDSILVITAWTAQDTVYGGTTMNLFDENGVFKTGKQKLVFFFGRPGDANVPSKNTTPGDELYNEYKDADHGFRMEKHLENYKTMLLSSTGSGNGSSTHLDWLDRLSLTQIQYTLGESLSRDRTAFNHNGGGGDAEGTNGVGSHGWGYDTTQDKGADRIPFLSMTDASNGQGGDNSDHSWVSSEGRYWNWGCRPDELDLQSLCCLVVELPVLPHPVLYEGRPYQQVVAHNPMRQNNTSSMNPGSHPCAIKGEKGQVEFSLLNGSFQGSMLGVIADWDLEHDNFPNLAEEQNRKLNINTIRGASDPNAKPNLEQKAILDRIINAAGSKLISADKDLLYRFRYALTENKKALTKVLLSIDWDMERERNEVGILLELWKSKAPIDVADALKLLSNEREFQNAVIRQYAVDVLRAATDEELHLFLLQLVQALRYEPLHSSDQGKDDDESERSFAASNAISNLTSSMDLSLISRERDTSVSPLAAFLFERAGASESLALSLYWFLKVETDTQDDDSRNLYTGILSAFIHFLMLSIDGATAAAQVQALDGYLFNISSCQREARQSGSRRWMIGRNEFVEASLNRLLVERGLQIMPGGFDSLPSPLDPNVRLLSLDKMSKMFKSQLYPCVIDFLACRKSIRIRDSISKNYSKIELEGPMFKNRILFKCGDDLRQDQLIMHLFSLMDMLLKKVNLDLKLRTYGILATGQKDGLMEFVDSMPISGVETPRQTIFDYLQAHNPDPADLSKIHPECLDTFIKSCAGMCVLTYILGVGDRHHDNIMLTKKGQLFHIDFGFVFGKDPKPMPPPFRLSRGMVDAMGGQFS